VKSAQGNANTKGLQCLRRTLYQLPQWVKVARCGSHGTCHTNREAEDHCAVEP
jgi:hypothetical protein